MARRSAEAGRGRHRARARPVLHVALALLLASAALPASAASSDPARRPDCSDAAKANCVDAAPGGKSGSGAAVVLPDLIVDLFPNPPAGFQPGRPDASPPGGTPPSGNGGTTPPSAGNAPAVGNLALAEPPRAIVGDFVPDEVLVTVDGDAAAVEQIARAFGLQVRSQRRSMLLGATLVRYGIPDGRPVGVVLAELAADGRTGRREPNHVYTLQQAAGIANYAFAHIALDSASANGRNVRIGVVDTAADAANPALRGVIAASFDALPDTPVTARDHGTSVDGLIAGVGSMKGMAPGAQIYHARAFEDGKATMDSILAALDWAAGQDVRIINMSFVGPKNELLGTACRNARALGIVLVAAAGNNGPGAPYGYPAAFAGVIAVTATDSRDGLMPRANRGPYVYIAAPGVDMLAPTGGGSDLVTGTSFAAAIVSGAVANIVHARPDMTADQIEKALADTARDLGDKGRDDDFGYGLIDTRAAEAAKE